VLSDQSVVASIGKQAVTVGEVTSANPATFAALLAERAHQERRLEADYAQSYHQVLAQQLDAMLDQRALELEAAARHTSTAQVLSGLKVPAVTDEEAHAFYESRKERAGQPYEELKPAILEYLGKQKRDAATRAFYDQLRSKHGIASALPPYRATVAASGPERGPAGARVTIVEFADFQCPFCQRAEPMLQAVMSAHPDDVRLVFRQLPLTDLHPSAALAANASLCAQQQGQFWPMHDAMFADQAALSAPKLTATAARLGMNEDQFSKCLSEGPADAAAIAKDAYAAAELGIDSTPYFFVNGRPVRGLVSAAQLEEIVTQELAASPKAGG
jgi:protein-disulfide isomerase